MKEKTGNRIIQILLLLIIAGGFFGIIMTLKGSGGMSGIMPGGMPGGGFPGMDGSSAKQADPAVAVEGAIVTRETVSQFIQVNGDVVSDVSVDLYPDIAGKLVEQRVTVGSYVRKGDVVAVVDPSAPGEFYSTSNVLSTITGTVTAVYADIGDTVMKSSPVAEVGDLSNLSLVTYIPERYITCLKAGLNAGVTFEAFPGRVFSARVVQLNPVVDAHSRSLEIKLEIINPDSGIRAGMFASITLITRESPDCISIPVTAVSTYYSDSIVYVVKDDNSLERRVVETGLASEEKVEIISGLEEGEIIVTRGSASVTGGTVVRIVNDLESREK